MVKNCLICGCKVKVKGRIFCSQKCYFEWNRGKNHPRWKGRTKKECLNCGDVFNARPCEVKNGKGKFCSKKCQGIWHGKNMQGGKHPNWKGGLIKQICKTCKKEFKIEPCIVKSGYGKFCSVSCNALWNVKHGKKKNTSIELRVEKYLKKLGIVYESQKVIPEGRTVSDFYIPEQRLVIYADGKYWHGRPEVKTRDQNQDFRLGFNGYSVLRLGEGEINNGKFIRKLNGKLN